MPLGMEVGLGPGDFVLDGDPDPQQKGHSPLGFGPGDFVLDGKLGTQLPQKRYSPHPIFGPCLLWPNGWMDEDATWYGSRPRPKPHCVRRGPSSRDQRGTAALPLFCPCLLWPRSPISTTAELLSQYFCIIEHISNFTVRLFKCPLQTIRTVRPA